MSSLVLSLPALQRVCATDHYNDSEFSCREEHQESCAEHLSVLHILGESVLQPSSLFTKRGKDSSEFRIFSRCRKNKLPSFFL